MEKAINYFETALGIASSSDWGDQLFWNHYCLVKLFFEQGGSKDAHAHIGCAKSHAINDSYPLDRAMDLVLIGSTSWKTRSPRLCGLPKNPPEDRPSDS